MGSITNFAENKLLDHLAGKTAYTMPTTYVGLFTAAPGETGGGTEVTGGDYARQAFGPGNAASGQIANSADITFPTASASWGTITHFAVFDASSAGNMLWYGSLDTSKTVASGDTLKFATGALTLTLD